MAKINSFRIYHVVFTNKHQIAKLLPILRTYTLQNLFQSVLAARMTAYHVRIAFFRSLHSTSHHFMGYRIRKENDQIRTANLFTQFRRHLGKHFCLTVILFTDFLVLADHSVMTAYDNNTHIKTSCKLKTKNSVSVQ